MLLVSVVEAQPHGLRVPQQQPKVPVGLCAAHVPYAFTSQRLPPQQVASRQALGSGMWSGYSGDQVPGPERWYTAQALPTIRAEVAAERTIGSVCPEDDLETAQGDVSSMNVGDMGVVQRSDGSWKYAKLQQKNDNQMTFEVETGDDGCIKEFPKEDWDKVKAFGSASEPEMFAQTDLNVINQCAVGLLGFVVGSGAMLAMHRYRRGTFTATNVQPLLD